MGGRLIIGCRGRRICGTVRSGGVALLGLGPILVKDGGGLGRPRVIVGLGGLLWS